MNRPPLALIEELRLATGIPRTGQRRESAMLSAKQCRLKARECIELARQSHRPERPALLPMADAWLKLADMVAGPHEVAPPLVMVEAPSTDTVQ
jgi:hypothetical protein